MANFNKQYPPPLTSKENRELFKLLEMDQSDEETKEKIINGNMRLVAHTALKYMNSGVPADDLIGIGSIGLMKAVNSFKTDKATQFATYATRCIANEILMYLRKHKKSFKDTSFETVLIPGKNGMDLTLEDTIPDVSIEDFSESFVKEDDRTYLYKALEGLSGKDKEVIELYYLNGLTYQEVADKMGISRSYAVRIGQRAIEYLQKMVARMEKQAKLKEEEAVDKLKAPKPKKYPKVVPSVKVEKPVFTRPLVVTEPITFKINEEDIAKASKVLTMPEDAKIVPEQKEATIEVKKGTIDRSFIFDLNASGEAVSVDELLAEIESIRNMLAIGQATTVSFNFEVTSSY